MRQSITYLARIALLLILSTSAIWADPASYRLEPEGSRVEFYYQFGGNEVLGTIPVTSTRLLLDFQDVRRSKVDVVLDVTGARAGFVFATQAMKDPSVLDAQNHPQMTFSATRFVQSGNIALVSGMLTLRGQTRPITLRARLFRAPGTTEQDFTRLVVRMSGKLSRAEFGATGYRELVGDEIRLEITAALAQDN